MGPDRAEPILCGSGWSAGSSRRSRQTGRGRESARWRPAWPLLRTRSPRETHTARLALGYKVGSRAARLRRARGAALALHRGRTHATRKKGQRGGGLASHQAHTRVDEQIKPWRCEVVDDFFRRPCHHHQPQVDACERGRVCQRDNVRIVTPRF
eukprot:scaffold39856_cov64-Phaeocystis_antarctica.AAC.5